MDLYSIQGKLINTCFYLKQNFESLEGALICHCLANRLCTVWSLTLYIVELLMSLHVYWRYHYAVHAVQ